MINAKTKGSQTINFNSLLILTAQQFIIIKVNKFHIYRNKWWENNSF